MATPTELEHYKQLLLTTLTRLGCLINWEKSSLKPSPQKEFIGYIVITESTGELSNNQSSGHSHPATETRYPSHPEVVNCNARVLARIAGQCIVMTKALVLGKLLGRRSSWDSPLLLDGPTRDELTRWYHALESWNSRPIKTKTSRSSTRHRCFTNRMGSSSQWKAGNRLSGQTSSANTFKLPRVVGHPSSHKRFRERPS